MELLPTNPLMTTIQQGSDKAPAGETLAAKNQNFAEEASFFFSFFKGRPVKPMPDQPLILLLQKSRQKKKIRTVSKKEKTGCLFMRKKKKEAEDQANEDEPENGS